MEEINQTAENSPKKLKVWIWIVVLVILIIGGYFVYIKYFSSEEAVISDKKTTSNENSNSAKSSAKEEWAINSMIVKENKTSTDTHKLSDGTYRMYYMDQGEIYYAESTDGVIFGTGKKTGIKEVSGKMISNPAVLEVSASNWIMIYEMAPLRQPGSQAGPPSAASQRDLFLAKSQDGKSFIPVGNAINSSKEDNYFASVPDLIMTPDGKIRMYYVSGGQAIGSATSTDNGVTWIKESGYRLENQAVDPDVLFKDGKWVMYYSVLDPSKNALYKANSDDGLVWKNQTKILSPTVNGAIVDPDVFETTADNYVMFFGQSSAGGSTNGETINLYRATFNGQIFN